MGYISGWPFVGNEGINLYIGILGIHSLIPYESGQLDIGKKTGRRMDHIEKIDEVHRLRWMG